MNVQRVISYRHFCNKIWNAVRYALPLLESKGNGQVPRLAKAPGNDLTSLRNDMSLADRWILSRLVSSFSVSFMRYTTYPFVAGERCSGS